MFKIEKKFLDWVEKNLIVIVLVFGTILSVPVRYAFRNVVSGDYIIFLEKWYNEINTGGGIQSLRSQVGNYNFLYQTCIAIMTYLPVRPLYAYKMLSIFFDYLLAVAVGSSVGLVSDGNRKNHAVAAYFMVLFSPIVLLNSSAWAQCDAIYVFWAVAAVHALLKEKYPAAFILLGMSFSFKLQAVFILPFFLYVYFMKRKFSILHFTAVPLTMIATGLPGLFFGRSIFDIFLVYLDQTDSYKQVALNYPSFWTILFEYGNTDYYVVQKPAALLLTVVILAAFMIWWINIKIELNNKNMIYMAFVLSYTCVLFLPQMHERYGYLYEILAIIVLFLNRKTVKFMVPLYIITLTTYGKYLFGLPHPVDVYTGIANIFVWLGYVHLISKDMCIREGIRN